jgi:hypothetical protein
MLRCWHETTAAASAVLSTTNHTAHLYSKLTNGGHILPVRVPGCPRKD